MHVVFNGVSSCGYIWLFSHEREYIDSENFEIAGNESSKATSLIADFLEKQKLNYQDISNIIVVVGPWSFTGIRSISLIVNTLAYIYPHISLTPVNFFDLFDTYPIVKSSSKRDLFVKYDEKSIIEIVTNSDFESRYTLSDIYGDTDINRFSAWYVLKDSIDYIWLMNDIQLKKEKRIAPLYIKKPNIS